MSDFASNINRVLIPTSCGPNVQITAQLIDHLTHHHPLEITTLYAQSDKQSPSARVNAQTATAIKDTNAEAALQVIVAASA